MENDTDKFLEIVKNMSQEKVIALLDDSKNKLSKEGYIFFENLILSIRKQEKTS